MKFYIDHYLSCLKPMQTWFPPTGAYSSAQYDAHLESPVMSILVW